MTTGTGCTGNTRLTNGIQIFPGSMPIYRGNQLVGAIGVSGDGIDQDDMVAFLGLANAGKIAEHGNRQRAAPPCAPTTSRRKGGHPSALRQLPAGAVQWQYRAKCLRRALAAAFWRRSPRSALVGQHVCRGAGATGAQTRHARRQTWRARAATALGRRPLRHSGAGRHRQRARRGDDRLRRAGATAAGCAAGSRSEARQLVPHSSRRRSQRLDRLRRRQDRSELFGRRQSRHSQGIPRTDVGAQPPAAMDAQTEAARVPAPDALPDDRILLQRPMGRPLEAIIPAIDPNQVPPPSPLLPRETVPVPDRWRIVDQLGIVNQRAFDPYNPNTLKGDRPVFGEDWFFNLGVISDTLFEARKLPTPIGAQSSQDSQANDQFGRGRQSTFAQNLIVSLSLLKGSTTFKPPELEFRFVPVLNYNVSKVEEVRALRIDPRSGTRRTDNFVGIQEAFVDYEYNIASEYFDFDDIRVGIQPFISDFRGFLFQDQPVGIRFSAPAKATGGSTTWPGSAGSTRTPTAA